MKHIKLFEEFEMEDDGFHQRKVWEFILSRPFYNPNFKPMFSTAREIYDEHIKNNPENKKKYDEFKWSGLDDIHREEENVLRRRGNYDALRDKKITLADAIIDNIKMKNENINKTKYWILKSKGSGPSETIFQTEEFDKDLIQKTFDMECWNLQNGEDLEYGKEDKKQFYPAMLYVEKEQDILIVHTRNGHKKQYFPKYDKDGFPIREH